MIRKSRKQGGEGKRSPSSANISLSSLPCARTYDGHLNMPMRRRHPVTKENPLVPAAQTSNLPHPQLPHNLMTALSSGCSSQNPCLFSFSFNLHPLLQEILMVLPIRYPESSCFSPSCCRYHCWKGFLPMLPISTSSLNRVLLLEYRSYHVIPLFKTFSSFPSQSKSKLLRTAHGILVTEPVVHPMPLWTTHFHSIHTGFTQHACSHLRTFAPSLPMPWKLSPLMSLCLHLPMSSFQ